MVDTVRCGSFEDITVDFLHKLLVGAIHRGIDKKNVASRSPPNQKSSLSSASISSRSHAAPSRALTGSTLVNPSFHQSSLEPLRENQTEPAIASGGEMGGPSRTNSRYSLPSRTTTMNERDHFLPSRSTTFGSSKAGTSYKGF